MTILGLLQRSELSPKGVLLVSVGFGAVEQRQNNLPPSFSGHSPKSMESGVATSSMIWLNQYLGVLSLGLRTVLF